MMLVMLFDKMLIKVIELELKYKLGTAYLIDFWGDEIEPIAESIR